MGSDQSQGSKLTPEEILKAERKEYEERWTSMQNAIIERLRDMNLDELTIFQRMVINHKAIVEYFRLSAILGRTFK